VQGIDQEKYASIQFMHPNGISSYFGHKKMIFAGYWCSCLNCTIENHGQNQSILPCLFKINNKDNEEIWGN